ncbi:hypothetical protein [Rhodocista pekingensis]|uniref:Uncharacterized protein n=1 Tax=Rhodocista pekingensis TaxID=201185 RepID=A0ABW2KSI7_9PROT
MTTTEQNIAFVTACDQLGLDPANANHFILECARQGLDPRSTSMSDLDRNASELWASVRRLKRA